MWALTLSSVEDFRGRKRNIKLTEMEHKIQHFPSTNSRCVGRRDKERAADWDLMLPVCPENKPTLKHNGMIDDLWANNSFINYNLIYEKCFRERIISVVSTIYGNVSLFWRSHKAAESRRSWSPVWLTVSDRQHRVQRRKDILSAFPPWRQSLHRK